MGHKKIELFCYSNLFMNKQIAHAAEVSLLWSRSLNISLGRGLADSICNMITDPPWLCSSLPPPTPERDDRPRTWSTWCDWLLHRYRVPTNMFHKVTKYTFCVIWNTNVTKFIWKIYGKIKLWRRCMHHGKFNLVPKVFDTEIPRTLKGLLPDFYEQCKTNVYILTLEQFLVQFNIFSLVLLTFHSS